MAVVGETKLKVELSTHAFLIGIAVFILFIFFVDLVAYFQDFTKLKIFTSSKNTLIQLQKEMFLRFFQLSCFS
jgi:uncharacterized membrane protein (DUF485 family)